MDRSDRTEDDQIESNANLERRFYAALIDMVLVGAGCFAMFQADSVLVSGRAGRALVPAGVLLGILCGLEAVTGRSAGKLAMRIHVEAHNGTSAGIVQFAVRAMMRWIGPVLAMGSLLTRDVTLASMLVGLAAMVVLCEIPICYITLFRRGGTLFDLVAGTRVR
jgi:uncharacterized RDD family membrane protein YckC